MCGFVSFFRVLQHIGCDGVADDWCGQGELTHFVWLAICGLLHCSCVVAVRLFKGGDLVCVGFGWAFCVIGGRGCDFCEVVICVESMVDFWTWLDM